MPEAQNVHYEPSGPTVLEFHRNGESFFRGLMGPIGSSKSTACVMEILRRSKMQSVGVNGYRNTRWAVIRNSYPELKSTTIKTWNQWCPREYGRFAQDSPIIHHVRTQDMDMEVMFLALDRDDDVKKLLSLELTGAWVNEAREIPKSIIDTLTGRVGRYPNKAMGGCTWSGVLADTNPPDDQSWWYQLAEGDTPEGWKFYSQPAGDSPEAENLQNLPEGYYKRIAAGKDADWIKVYIKGEYGFLVEGKAVYPMFRDRTHVATFDPIPGVPIVMGVDFGLTPSAIIAQKTVSGRWLILDELVTDNCGIGRFAETLYAYVSRHYQDFKVVAGWGDPAGNQRGANDERTAFEVMKVKSWSFWKPAPVPQNNLAMRLEVVVNTLNRMIDGDPGLLVHPRCKILRKGFSGGYHYKFIKAAGQTMMHETPAKNQYSHPHDALQYLLLGGGEYSTVLGRTKKDKERSEGRMCQGLDYDRFSPTREATGKKKFPTGWRGGSFGGNEV